MGALEIILALFILLNTGFLLAYSAGNETARPGLPMFYLALASIAVFLHFGKVHQVLPQKPEYYSETPPSVKYTYLNLPEIFPYYLGAKYFPEVGYKGFYDTIALADSLSAYPALPAGAQIRDLTVPYTTISAYDAKTRAEKQYLPNFKDERWMEFRNDYEYLKNLTFPGQISTMLQNSGLHTPPTWMVIGNAVANALPITGNWPYGAWILGKNWSQVEILPLVDATLIMFSFLFLWWGFGLAGASTFIVLLGVSYFTPMSVVGGAFLRFDWLFGMAAALAGLRKKHYFLAGFMLAFASALRIFPGFFLIGGFLAMLLQRLLGREPSVAPIVKYTLGALMCLLLFFSASVKLFNQNLWLEFRDSIILHSEAAYTENIGQRKVIPYLMKPEIRTYKEEQNNLEKLRDYSHTLGDFWFENRALTYSILLVVLVASIWGVRQVPAFEGALLIGGFALFTYYMPAHYYYAFMALVPVVLAHPKYGNTRNRALVMLFFIYWILAYFSPYFLPDPHVRNFCLSLLMGLYFTAWALFNAVQKGYSGE